MLNLESPQARFYQDSKNAPVERYVCQRCDKEIAWDEQHCDQCIQEMKEQKENDMGEQKQELQVKGESTPTTLIEMAITSGADLDKVEKLLELKERWDKNEAKKAFHKAMADFKANPIEIDKDRKVGYKTEKGGVSYNHASLANVVRKIGAELSKHGLAASWRTAQNGVIIVTCRITHSLGHFEETSLSASADNSGSKNSIQAIGSTISYLERYTLLALTGLATHEQDNDAAQEVDKITDAQVSDIRDQLIDLGLEKNEVKFLSVLGVESLENMPKSVFPKAQAILAAKRKEKK